MCKEFVDLMPRALMMLGWICILFCLEVAKLLLVLLTSRCNKASIPQTIDKDFSIYYGLLTHFIVLLQDIEGTE